MAHGIVVMAQGRVVMAHGIVVMAHGIVVMAHGIVVMTQWKLRRRRRQWSWVRILFPSTYLSVPYLSLFLFPPSLCLSISAQEICIFE